MGTAKLHDGRRWTVDGGKIKSLKRKYVIAQSDILSQNGEMASFSGVPAIGTEHPNHAGLAVKSYDVEEGAASKKKLLTITANYERSDGEDETVDEDVGCAVTEWGWDSSTEEHELVSAADGTPVINSAGDKFDRVPMVSAPAPIFTKVMKFRDRQSGAMGYNCKVNSEAITIGDVTCPIGTIFCLVAEKRLFGDEPWKYQYTVQLKLRSNFVKIEGAQDTTNIGWDVAVTDAGMRELTTDGRLVLIKAVDQETGKRCTVTSPELLDGHGHAVQRGGQSTQTVEPYNFRFMAYERVSIPDWFYSEPNVVPPNDDDDDE